MPKTFTKAKVTNTSSNIIIPMLMLSAVSAPEKSLYTSGERRNDFSRWTKILLVFFFASMALGVMFRGDIGAMLGRLIGNKSRDGSLPDDDRGEKSVAFASDTSIVDAGVSGIVASDVRAIIREGNFGGKQAYQWSPFVEAESISDTESANIQKSSSPKSQEHPQTLSITDGLVAYYPFNGNANDETGHGNNGVVHSAILTADRLGNPNRAYRFNGKDACIKVEDGSQFNFVSDMSIAAWVKPFEQQNFCAGIFDKSVGDGTPPVSWVIQQAYDSQNSYFFEYGDGNRYSSDDGQGSRLNLQHDVWSHISVTKAGSIIECYINGEKVGRQKVITDPYIAINGPKPLHIGCENNTRSFYGAIDEARFYNRALFPEEVKVLADKFSFSPKNNTIVIGLIGALIGGGIVAVLMGSGFFCYKKCSRRKPNLGDSNPFYGATDTDPLLGKKTKSAKNAKNESSDIEYQKAAMRIAGMLVVSHGSIQAAERKQEELSGRSQMSTSQSSTPPDRSSSLRSQSGSLATQSLFARPAQSPCDSTSSSSVSSSASSCGR